MFVRNWVDEDSTILNVWEDSSLNLRSSLRYWEGLIIILNIHQQSKPQPVNVVRCNRLLFC